jgi:hypothetical protein
VRAKLREPAIAERRERLSEQPAQLLDRHGLGVVLCQIFTDELGERHRASNPVHSAQHLEFSLERFACVSLGPETTALDALGIATADPVAVSPKRFAVGFALQPQDLTLLQHRRSLLSADPASGHHRARACEGTRPDQSDLATGNG